MPTESAPPAPPLSQPDSQGPNKCVICGLGSLSGSTSTSPADESVVLLGDSIERICGRCVASPDAQRRMGVEDRRPLRTITPSPLGLGLRGIAVQGDHARYLDQEEQVEEGTPGPGEGDRGSERERETSSGPSPDFERVMNLAAETPSPPSLRPGPGLGAEADAQSLSQSLPSDHPGPWKTLSQPLPVHPKSSSGYQVLSPSSPSPSSAKATAAVGEDLPPNPLLDVTRARVPSVGRGALYPGSIFKGTQTSGRSAYEVEVQILDINMAESTVCGYLSISHLTDSHPHLTTFFTGELIGMKYGFLTGTQYGATEHDDLRHWGRFEQFRRPATRSDIVRSELLFRDPLPDRSRGETKAKERDFVFMRIKERFLVPDHKVRDISGASFAGFYYAMVDLSPTIASHSEAASTPCTPLSPSSTTTPSARQQSYFDHRSPRPDGSGAAPGAGAGAGVAASPMSGKRRESTSKHRERERDKEVKGEATIRGYYFHSLNQEPFQELFLTHVPTRSSSTREMR